jgi:CheY-like chemotaxis protein
MDMGVPDTPVSPPEDEDDPPRGPKYLGQADRRPGIVVTGENVPINFKGHKRRRDSNENPNSNANKYRRTCASPFQPRSESNQVAMHAAHANVKSPLQRHVSACDEEALMQDDAGISVPDAAYIPPGLRHTNLRDVLQFLVNDLLKVGGRPESAIAQETDGGEVIEVKVRSPNGDTKIKTVRWTVHPGVPDTILIDEQSLVKVISSMYSNAVKFTEEGDVDITARLSPRSRYVVITMRDTGTGIREEFRPKLFQAFSKEDDSLTRHSEGLGLGLMVAKGLARKLGGDLTLVHTETSGPSQGSEFELRVPVTPGDITSRPSTPSGSPGESRLTSPAHADDLLSFSRARSDSLRPLRPSSARQKIPTPRRSGSPPKLMDETSSPPKNGTLRLASSNAVGKSGKAAGKRPADFDRLLSQKYPLTFLVVEDNKINRKLLVSMLSKLGYKSGKEVFEAYDGADAVRQMQTHRENSIRTRGEKGTIDVVLMDLWMPFMDGYEASEKILGMAWDDDVLAEDSAAGDDGVEVDQGIRGKKPTILAVTADVTDGALERAATAGMKGFLTKPFKLVDLEKLILEYFATRVPVGGAVGAVV